MYISAVQCVVVDACLHVYAYMYVCHTAGLCTVHNIVPV